MEIKDDSISSSNLTTAVLYPSKAEKRLSISYGSIRSPITRHERNKRISPLQDLLNFSEGPQNLKEGLSVIQPVGPLPNIARTRTRERKKPSHRIHHDVKMTGAIADRSQSVYTVTRCLFEYSYQVRMMRAPMSGESIRALRFLTIRLRPNARSSWHMDRAVVCVDTASAKSIRI